MSALYLCDRAGTPVSSAAILDVQESTTPSTSGRFVIKVPDGVGIQNPANVGDLVTKKAAGLLVFFPAWTRITYDDLLDSTNVDLTNSSAGNFGSRNTMILQPGGVLQSLATALTGGAPVQALVTWDTYSYTDNDPSNGQFSRLYVEQPSTSGNITCQVSFNGGANFVSVTDSTAFAIAHTGTSFIMQLTNASSGRVGIGSWSVLY
jgi:hypothetical protein